MHLHTLVGLIMALLGLTLPFSSMAQEYTCQIKSISELNNNGYFVTHGWAANYLNREFTLDSETGKVTSTTALKQRLNNYNKSNQPIFINYARGKEPLRIFTHFQDTGKYSLIEIQDTVAYKDSANKPYFYHTDVDMLLGGTCVIN